MFSYSQGIFPRSTKFSWSRNFSAVKKFYHTQRNFPQSKIFSSVKEIFQSQADYPQSRNFSTIKEIGQNQEIFHSQGHFYIVKEIFYKKDLLNKGNFPQTTKFSTIFFSLIKDVCHNKNFYVVKKFFKKQISKGFSKS